MMKARKARKGARLQAAVMPWVAEQVAKDRALARQVEARLAEMRIEQELAALRTKLRVSQGQLARRLGVSQPAIAKIESGRVKNLELKTVVRYAAALGARVHIAIEADRPRARSSAHA